MLRNFEGVITSYPEPENYVAGRAEEYFEMVYPDMLEKKSLSGISGIMNDQHFNLVPEGLTRLNRRKGYNQDPAHSSLKDKRSKRDELKEKKFKALTEKEKGTNTGKNPKQENEPIKD